MLAGDDHVLDSSETDTDLQLKREEEDQQLHRMANIQDILKMSQGSQNLCITQKESCT
jgi:hypothetical protein